MYYRHEEVVGHLRTLADVHPEFVSMSSIGRSFRDRDLRIMVEAMVETLMTAKVCSARMDGIIGQTESSSSYFAMLPEEDTTCLCA